LRRVYFLRRIGARAGGATKRKAEGARRQDKKTTAAKGESEQRQEALDFIVETVEA